MRAVASAKSPLIAGGGAPPPDPRTIQWEDYSHLELRGDVLTQELSALYHAALANHKSVVAGSDRMKELLCGTSGE